MSSWHNEPWSPRLEWNTSSGRLLRVVIATLSGLGPVTINLFGSGPLQMGVSKNMVSNDLDMFESPGASELLGKAGLLKGQADPFVEICGETVFTASPNWLSRAHTEKIGVVSVVFPHPIDILVSKVKRMAEKDFKAFEVVISVTGHPTESELIESLQRVVDLYRPSFDEETATDPVTNTRLLWQRIYGHDIDVKKEIISPALALRKVQYGEAPEQGRAMDLLAKAVLEANNLSQQGP